MLSRSSFRVVGQARRAFCVYQFPPPPPTYNERMEKAGRPVSPHVEIYKFPPTALTSITHRVTGTLLAFGMSCSRFVAILPGGC